MKLKRNDCAQNSPNNRVGLKPQAPDDATVPPLSFTIPAHKIHIGCGGWFNEVMNKLVLNDAVYQILFYV